MKDMRKTKAQLVEELEQLRVRNAELESFCTKTNRPDRTLLCRLVDQMLEATVILDWEGNLLHGNALAAHVIGVDSPADLRGRNIAGIVHPDSLADAAADLAKVKQSSAPFSAKYQLLINGRTVYIDSHGLKIELADGSVDLVSFRDVTGERDTAIELERQQRLFQSMVENANDIIYTIHPDSKLLYVSPNWKQMLGHDPEEVIGTSFTDHIHPEDLPACLEFLQKVMQTGEKHEGMEYRVQHKDGSWKWHMSNASTMVTPEGETLFAGIARDISERKRFEEELSQSETMLKSVLDNSSQVIFVKDLEGKYLLINKRYEKLFGVKAEQIIGKTDYDIFPPEAAKKFQAMDQKAIAAGEPISEEEIVPQNDGDHTYLSVKFPLQSDDGPPFATCGIATDISRRKKIEEALEERVNERTRALEQSEKMFRALTESMNAMVVIANLETERVIYANPAATKLTGYSFEELTAEPAPTLFTPKTLQEAEQIRDSFLEGVPLPERAEVEIVTKTGEIRWFESAVALIEIEGQGLHKVVTSFDITERKLAEHALKESEKKFRALADSTTASIAIEGEMGNRFYFANQTLLDRAGITWEDMSQMSPRESLTSAAREAGQKAAEEAEASGAEQYRFEYQEDDQWREVNVVKTEVDGEPAVIYTSFDITKHKLAEESLAIFQRFAETSRQGFGMSDLKGYITYVNPAVARFTGLDSPEQGIGKHVTEFHPREYADKLVNEVVPYVLEHGEWTGEMPMEHVDGSTTPMILSMFLLRDDLGHPQRFAAVLTDISERKQAETALKAEQERLMTLFDGISEVIYVSDPETYEVLFANKYLRDALGKSLVGGICYEEFQGFDKPCEFCTNSRILAQRDEAYQWEHHNPVVGRDYLVSDRIIKWPDGRDVRFELAIDISDRKRAERELEASEKKFRTLAEATTAQISIVQDNRYVYANQAFLDYYGIDIEDLLRTTVDNLIMGTMAEEAEREAAKSWESAMERGDRHFHLEYQDSEGNWFQANVAIADLDGRESFICMTFDITDLKRAQEALAANEERYRTIFETAGTGMISFGEDGVITLANEEWTKLSGYSIVETVGQMTWFPFFTDESLTRMKEYHEMRTKDPSSAPKAYEAQFVDRAGKIHDGIINIQIVPGTQTRVASFQDMTELKQAQSEMYRADKMAALGQIIAGVAHEINNPNNFIFFNLPILRRYFEAIRPILEQHLEKKPDLKILNMPYRIFLEDVFKLLENMEHGSKRITGIVSELKTYVRNDNEAATQPGQLAPVIDRVMALVGKQVRKMVKTLDVEVAKDLPLVSMNPGKIEQVLINLMINAGQAADKEDSWVKVTAARENDKGQTWVKLLIADNGSGIPNEIRDQIFEPFFTSKGRDQGTGLGLSISQRIVEEHGGDISVQSTPNKGTTFIIRLPAVSA